MQAAENIKTIELDQSPEWLPGSLFGQLEVSGRLVLSGAFSRADRLVLKKRRRVAASDWMPRHRVMSNGILAGSKWSNDLTPYTAGIMDASFFPGVQTIIACATPQTGKSEAVNNCIGFASDMDPGPAMYVYPDRDTAAENSRDRLQPMFEKSPRLRSYLTGSDDDLTNIRIRLRHMPIYLAWARSASRLANKPIRYLVLDEIDKYPAELTGETDPIGLAEKRTITYLYNRRIWKISTPTIETGAIWRALTTEAQARFDYHVRCPACGKLQKMVFSEEGGTHRICWPKGVRDPEVVERDHLAWYQCAHCDEKWTDRKRDLAVRTGQWVEQKSGTELFAYLTANRPTKIGFHVPAWLSPFVSLSTCAAAFLKAQKGQPDYRNKLKDFKNAIEAAPWKIVEGERRESVILALKDDRPRGRVPGGNVVAGMTAAVDTQDNGFWYEIRAWGWGGKTLSTDSWQVREGFVMSFAEVERILWEDEYSDPEGKKYAVLMTLQDCLGHRTSEVYDFCIRNRNRVFPSIGRDVMAAPFSWTNLEFYPGSKKALWGGLKGVVVNTKFFKDRLAGMLEIIKGDPGAFLFHAELPEEFAAHYLSEVINEKGLWECPSGKPNHLWDCAVLNLVCHEILGIKYWARPAPSDSSGPPALPKSSAGGWIGGGSGGSGWINGR